MTISSTEQGRQVTIRVSGTFNFKCHQQFRETYEGKPRDYRYTIDFSGLDAIDSSALGMLLILREHADSDQGEITLTNVPPEIRKILEVARFQELFRM